MDRPRLALLNAAYEDEHTTRNFRRELDADVAEFRVTEGDLPPTFEYDGAVVTGSKASVYWDEAWIPELKAWVATAVDRRLPVLGVCYGHQVVADVLGGRVEDMGEFELGYSEIRRVGDSRLLDGLDRRFLAFTSHGDAVVELPPGAEPTAENEYSNHGFRKGRVFGVQFHPEYDRETAVAVAESKEFLGTERIERVVDGVTRENYLAACETKRLFENFTDFVREVRDVERAPAGADD